MPSIPQPLHLSVTPGLAGERLDRALAASFADISRARFQALIAAGAASVNGQPVRQARYKLVEGDEIVIDMPPPRPARPVGEAMALNIVYEDDHVIVIDKPAGLVVHPGAGNRRGTLVNALIDHCGDSLSGIGGELRPGIVHRLDKDTSGLLVAAKSDLAHKQLSEQFAAHGRDGRLERAYVALVWGRPARAAGTIDAPITRDIKSRTRMAVARTGGGRAARSAYKVIETFADDRGKALASLLEVRLETGRTHQIRVHMSHIGHPVMGDAVYGAHFTASANRLNAAAAGALVCLGRQALHAARLGFEHPASGERADFESRPPADMARLIEALRSTKKGT